MERSEANNAGDGEETHPTNCSRDSEYYFEDGSITIRVGDVLFKVWVIRCALEWLNVWKHQIHTSQLVPYSSKNVFIVSLTEEGSAVILVEKVLFKIHPSRLFGPDSERSLESLLAKCSIGDNSSATKGLSVNNPIVLSEFDASQFRNFLYLFYARPLDPGFRQFLNGETVGSPLQTASFYMDVAIVSHHMNMEETEEWALSRLKPMLDGPDCYHFANWHFPRYFKGLRYAKLIDNRTLADGIQRALGLRIVGLFSERPKSLQLSWETSSCHSVLEPLYRNTWLRTEQRAAFGQTVCVILHAGHESSTWTDHLTRSERATLFAMQAYLTPLPKYLSCSWVKNQLQLEDLCAKIEDCSEDCDYALDELWTRTIENAFSKPFDSSLPLAGVDALCTLVLKEAKFVMNATTQKQGTGPVSSKVMCNKCMARALETLHHEINQVFSKVADLHDQIERDGYVTDASFGSQRSSG
ncbi:The BTB (BR-C, ttk and bab)/POZ (Pox virus and Zinc finger) domain [Ceratobasidium sp. AG-Ba]|nr:The BTB (BR-C, ttk and bab)/POZ (Pox virus and Zinc finger) domain [Ceratobasidium sp. AG-Ba]